MIVELMIIGFFLKAVYGKSIATKNNQISIQDLHKHTHIHIHKDSDIKHIRTHILYLLDKNILSILVIINTCSYTLSISISVNTSQSVRIWKPKHTLTCLPTLSGGGHTASYSCMMSESSISLFSSTITDLCT